MRTKQIYKPPPFAMIQSAVQGDITEIEAILRYYERYMTALSLRPCRDINNNISMEVDPEILRRMESRLIDRILKFKIF